MVRNAPLFPPYIAQHNVASIRRMRGSVYKPLTGFIESALVNGFGCEMLIGVSRKDDEAFTLNTPTQAQKRRRPFCPSPPPSSLPLSSWRLHPTLSFFTLSPLKRCPHKSEANAAVLAYIPIRRGANTCTSLYFRGTMSVPRTTFPPNNIYPKWH
jgi:hypothetical protein